MTIYSKAIETTELGVDLNAGPDKIFRAQALPSTSNTSSSAFRLGNPMGRNEVKVVVNTAGTLTAALTIEIQTSATEGGSYVTVAGGTFTVAIGAIVVGQDLAKYIPPRESTDLFTKIKLTTTANESAMKVDAYLVYVS